MSRRARHEPEPEPTTEIVELEPKAGTPDESPALDKTLNEYLQEAFNMPITVEDKTGRRIRTTPAELLSKQLVMALATGKLVFADGRKLEISMDSFMNLVNVAFRQISPPVKPAPESTEIDEIDQMSDEEIQRLYAEMHDDDSFAPDDVAGIIGQE